MNNRSISLKNIQYYLACIFFVSLNFEMFCPFVEEFSVAKMAGYLYVGGLVLSPKSLFSTKRIETPLGCAFAMFFLMVLSSVIHSASNSVFFDTSIFMNIVIFWLLLNHQRKDSRVFREGLLWFALSCFIVGTLFLYGVGLTFGLGERVRIFGDNPNATGIKMSVGILFLLDYCLNHYTGRKVYKPWLLLLSIPMFSLLFATASRTALIIIVSGLILFILFRQSKTKISKVVWPLIGILGLVVGFYFLGNQEIIMSRMIDSIEEGNISGRDQIWNEYMGLIGQHPLLGTGFSGHYNTAKSVLGQVYSPHNVLIEVTLYSGIIGLSFFLVLLFHIFKNAVEYKKRLQILGPLITSMAIIGMVLANQALGIKLFWTLAAYCISYRFENNSINSI